MFGKDKQTLLGLDIGSFSIKLVELSRLSRGYRLQSCVIEPLAPGLVVDKQIQDVDAVAAVIRRMTKAANSRHSHVVTAIGGDNIITRVVTLPLGLSELELEEQAMLEAEQSLGIKLDAVNVDFEVLGPTQGDRINVLLAATRKDYIDSHLMAVQLAGLTLKIVDIEAFALENASPFYARQMPEPLVGKTVALIDLGHTTITVNLLHNGKSVGHQSQRFGCQQLHESLLQQSGMTSADIQHHLQQGSLPEQYQKQCVQPFCDTAASYISRLLQVMPGNGLVPELDRVILSGGGALLNGISHSVEAVLQHQVLVAMPLEGVDINPRLSQSRLRRHGASLMVALGLAMRGFDV
ncbi:MAG: pilus assembly protein PilM [Gammaproteobacteria bacterium]|nr:pilus assembly protein PilM [Gammaproteobacteria bacterium]